ncbi:hypothetical protein [Hymenobacter norwichensis]|uniref:hypothetical protein n=1 Tax=Hymenobacter norwichensis TaxID=223903 RepID=UPI0012FB9C23|nr:hypothetical protein [Hymenobacter norwichensis]
MLRIIVGFLLASTLLFGCDDDDAGGSGQTSVIYTTAISVSENGAPPYVLNQAQIASSTYQGPTANLVINGKLNSGPVIRVTFSQSSPTVAGSNVTDVVEMYSETQGNATQTSGKTTRNATTNAVSGSFTGAFSNGTIVSGTISGLLLQ